jgi:putative methyltransferase (TIGR04325 family)
MDHELSENPARLQRARQISRVLGRLQGSSLGAALVRLARTTPLLGSSLAQEVGFRGAFTSADAARTAAAGVARLDQDHPGNVDLHLQLSQKPRPSDAAAIAQLGFLADDPHLLVDLGGNVGNLYYLYREAIAMHPDTRWLVHDLPGICAAGARIAAERSAEQLSFDPDMTVIARADVLLASGVLHYFEEPLHDLLARHDALPQRVIVNRTPLSESSRTYTVQDGGAFFALCVLHPRSELLAGMAKLGYRLAAEWPAPDLRLDVPLWPEFSAPAYSGFAWTLAP